MSEASPREWRFYLDDMIGFGEKTLRYANTVGRAGFAPDEMAYDASVRNLELVGEAATRIPDGIRNAHPEIPWRLIIATRNRLIHGYLGIDDDTLWSIIQDELPELIRQLRTIQDSP